MHKQLHVAFAAFTPAFYRWEIQRMLPVTYPDGVHMEPDVGQVEDDLLPDGVTAGEPVWGIYGRCVDGEAEHICDCDELLDAIKLVRGLGASGMYVLPGPVSQCHGRRVVFENDDPSRWDDDWKLNADRMTRCVGIHFGDVINNYADAWAKILPTVEMPYKSQYLLEKLIELMKRAV